MKEAKTNNNRKILITEIAEDDFRRLNLHFFEYKKVKNGNITFLQWQKKDANAELDEIISYSLENGYENNLEDLKTPITFAFHIENNEKPKDYYLDKFMNQFSGPTTCQIGVGIKHLYSTRDYFEDHEDYWRVRKDETSIIYRVYLSEKWLKKFVLKHKNEVTQRFSDTKWVESGYDLQEDGTWKETYRVLVEKLPNGCISSTPYKLES